MGGEEGVPEGAVSPIGGEAHFREQRGIEGAQQADQAFRPVRSGFDAADQVHEEDEGVVDPRLLLRHGGVDEEIGEQVPGLLSRQLELEDKLAVPQAGVVGGAVPEHAEVVHQRAEGLLVHPEGVGDCLPDGGLLQLPEEIGNVSERRDLDDHPGWRPRHEELGAVVLDEFVPAALHFIMQLHECARMDERGGEVLVLQIAERAEGMPHLVGPAGAEGDFDALARLDDELPELAVEDVELPKLLEGGPGDEEVAVSALGEGKAIGREAVVIVVLEAMPGEGFVPHDETAGFQEVELLLIGSGGLAHGRPLPFVPALEKSNLPGAHRGEAGEVLLAGV